MQVTRATFIPLLAPMSSDRIEPGAVVDEYCADLSVIYTFGPQFGRRVVTHTDLDQMQLAVPSLRQTAFQHLEVLSSRAEFHGQPPALMLSFEGLESSLVLANDFWSRLEGAVPGELVVGVPARDVVIVTGSQSGTGMEKVRRCVERVFFAGGDHPLSRSLLVRRGGAWEPFDRPARRPAGRPGFGPGHQHGLAQPPRQYQEHPSWPGEQMRPVSAPIDPRRRQPMRPAAAGLGGRPMPQGMRPGPMTGHGSMTNHGGPMTGPGAYGPPPQRQGPPPRGVYSDVSDIAQFSAMPYSAMPYSAVPQSDSSSYSPSPQLRSAPSYDRPTHDQPRRDEPRRDDSRRDDSRRDDSRYGEARYDEARYEEARFDEPRFDDARYDEPRYDEGRYDEGRYDGAKPAYRDDVYSTGTQPRYSDYAPSSDGPDYQPEPARPEYPGTWNRTPEHSASRPEWSSPRARFSSR